MAHSLEIRMPFLDFRLIEFALRLPLHWKIFGLSEKHFLRHTFANLVPASIFHRPKQPYRAPIREAFPLTGPSDYVDDLLSENTVRQAGYFNPAKVAGLTKKVRHPSTPSVSETEGMAFLGILSTQLIHHQFIENFDAGNLKTLLPDKRIAITAHDSPASKKATLLLC
jgi:asparagine synthase (glutamine-hydrolysing)